MWRESRAMCPLGHIFLLLLGMGDVWGILQGGLGLPAMSASGSPWSPSALVLLPRQDAGGGDKEGTQSRANSDYLEQV